jgi:ParB family chromosome partitioning protein
MTIEIVDIAEIRPADYNPRKINAEQFENLKQSLLQVGFVIPVLVNRANGVIIAGHQRTKAAKAIGIERVPAIKIDNVAYGDEIKFNQMHNGVDVQQGYSAKIEDSADLPFREFVLVDSKRFEVVKSGHEFTKEMCRLILRYGNVFSCVICGGQSLVGANYIKACQLLNIEVNTYRLPDELFDTAKMFLEGKYGVYSYDEIKRNTYVQGLAQMFRRVEKSDEVAKENHSTLYKNLVLPYLAEHEEVSTVLDFGCGKGAYIDYLKKTHRAVGVEFYNNNGKSINVSKGNQQIDSLIRYLQERKQFDVVVCDSVLNSVDSVKAEISVVSCCNLFSGGKLFISGRPYDEQVKKMYYDKSRATTKRYIEFLDENKFTALYRKGNWYFQHYHLPEDVEQLMERCGFAIDKMTWCKYGSSWQVEATKVRDLTMQEYIDAIDFEFNLPLPGEQSYNRQDDVKRVLGLL